MQQEERRGQEAPSGRWHDRLTSGRYRVRVLDPATGNRVIVGTYNAQADAEQALASAVADQGRGRWVRPDSGSVTLAEYASQWSLPALAAAVPRCGRGSESCTRDSCASTSCRPLVRCPFVGSGRRRCGPGMRDCSTGAPEQARRRSATGCSERSSTPRRSLHRARHFRD